MAASECAAGVIPEPAQQASVQAGTLAPVVMLAGFMAPMRHLEEYFGAALSTAQQPVLVVRMSPVGSSEDRARQLFYQLKGGYVDYGVDYKQRHLHHRYGPLEQALLPAWSERNPVHLVGHSFGGQTARVLQQLLEEQAFAGHDTNHRWVRSVTCISSPLNGSLSVYALGAREQVVGPALAKHILRVHAPARPTWQGWFRQAACLHQPVWCCSVGFLIGLVAHVLEWVDSPSLEQALFSFDVARFGIGRRYRGVVHASGECARSVLPCGSGSRIFQHANTAPSDMTLQGAYLWNQRIQHFDDTFYFSFIGDSFAHHEGNAPPAHDVSDGAASSSQAADPVPRQGSRLALAWLQWWTGWHSMSLDRSCFPFVVHPGTGQHEVTAWADGGGDGLLSAVEQAVPLHTGSKQRSDAWQTAAERVASGPPYNKAEPSPPAFTVVDEFPLQSHFSAWLEANALPRRAPRGSVASPPPPGVWHILRHGSDHVGVVPAPAGCVPQAKFFMRLWDILRSVDEACEGVH